MAQWSIRPTWAYRPIERPTGEEEIDCVDRGRDRIDGRSPAREDRHGIATGLPVAVAVDRPAVSVLQGLRARAIDQELDRLRQGKR